MEQGWGLLCPRANPTDPGTGTCLCLPLAAPWQGGERRSCWMGVWENNILAQEAAICFQSKIWRCCLNRGDDSV